MVVKNPAERYYLCINLVATNTTRSAHIALIQIAVAAGLGMASMAQAAVIVTFGQTSDNPTVTATDTTTTITGTAVAVTISQFARAGTPVSAVLDLSLTSQARRRTWPCSATTGRQPVRPSAATGQRSNPTHPKRPLRVASSRSSHDTRHRDLGPTS